MKNNEIIKLGIVDDDALIVSLLHPFLDSQKNLSVILAANSGKELLGYLENGGLIPDVLLLDMKMQEMDGVEIAGHLRLHFPEIKIIVISSHYQVSFLSFMIKTGIAAFLPKGVSPKELVHVLSQVFTHGFYFMEEQMEIAEKHLSVKSPKPLLEQGNALSSRELDVLKLLCKQKTAKEIGESLFINQRTVEGHKNNLFVKTGAKNMAGLVIYAIQHAIIKIEDLPAI